ncbi:MAG: hypothetical protein MZV70_40355 [Desulfobacterales bacterium]|nr:hypothetical protein [Desulfobacterales bacterium]
MDNVVRSTLHSFKVEDLNIYSMNNTISYSFDEERIGVGGGRRNGAGTGQGRKIHLQARPARRLPGDPAGHPQGGATGHLCAPALGGAPGADHRTRSWGSSKSSRTCPRTTRPSSASKSWWSSPARC